MLRSFIVVFILTIVLFETVITIGFSWELPNLAKFLCLMYIVTGMLFVKSFA